MESVTRMVKVISTVDRQVIINRPELNIRRMWTAKNQAQWIPFDIVYNLYFTVGFQNLINDGILYIPDMKDKKDLGIEPEDAEYPVNVIVLDDAQMKKLFSREVNKQDFVQTLAHLPMSQANALVDYAVKNECVDSEKIAYLKELTGRDVVQIIAKKRQSEEIDRIQAERDAAHKAENAGRGF